VGYINMVTHQEVATSNCQIKLLYLDWRHSKYSELPVIHCVFYWQPLVLTEIIPSHTYYFWTCYKFWAVQMDMSATPSIYWGWNLDW